MAFLKCIGVVLAVVAAAAAAPIHRRILDQQYLNFKITHNKTHADDSAEDNARFNIFLENQMKISKHNEAFARGEVTYEQRVNKFSDMTFEEIKQKMLGLFPMQGDEFETETSHHDEPEEDDGLPEFVDWREKGAVTPIRDQNSCGSGWAFSAVGALEGQRFLKTGKLETLSPQKLMDCSLYSDACRGGTFGLGFVDIQRTGFATEAEYSYNGTHTWQDKCKVKTMNMTKTVVGYRSFKKGSEQELKRAVATIGPVAAAISVHHHFVHYYGSLYFCQEYDDIQLNHAVLVVGYGNKGKPNSDYWIVKNSWGPTWGSGGYVLLARNRGRQNCGIAQLTGVPLL